MRHELVESNCPYCDEPGGTVGMGDHHLHPECHQQLGAELALLDEECRHNEMVPNDDLDFAWKCGDCGYVYGKGEMSQTLTSVVLRTDDEDAEGYAIEDRRGNVIGHVKELNGKEQRQKIAELLGVVEDLVAFKEDGEDENGQVEVWGIRHIPAEALEGQFA